MLIASMANTLKNVFQSNILLQLLFQTGNRTLISWRALINHQSHDTFTFFNHRPMNRLGMRQIVWIPRLSACLGTFITVQRSPLTSISFASTNSIIGFTDLQLSMVVLVIKCKNYTIFTDRVVTVTHLKNNIYWRQAVRTRT